MTAFEGVVLLNEPKALDADQRITPYVTGVDSQARVSLGFSESLVTDRDQLA